MINIGNKTSAISRVEPLPVATLCRLMEGLLVRGLLLFLSKMRAIPAEIFSREGKERKGLGWKFHRDLLATGNRLGLVMTEALLMGREAGKKGRNWLPT